VVNLLTSISTDDSAEFTAVNGDTLYAAGHGQGNPIGNITYVTEWYTITGGTGRFAGATGNFILTRQVDHTTLVTFGNFSGTLVLAKGH
jgi:hypothetical protein